MAHLRRSRLAGLALLALLAPHAPERTATADPTHNQLEQLKVLKAYSNEMLSRQGQMNTTKFGQRALMVEFMYKERAKMIRLAASVGLTEARLDAAIGPDNNRVPLTFPDAATFDAFRARLRVVTTLAMQRALNARVQQGDVDRLVLPGATRDDWYTLVVSLGTASSFYSRNPKKAPGAFFDRNRQGRAGGVAYQADDLVPNREVIDAARCWQPTPKEDIEFLIGRTQAYRQWAAAQQAPTPRQYIIANLLRPDAGGVNWDNFTAAHLRADRTNLIVRPLVPEFDLKATPAAGAVACSDVDLKIYSPVLTMAHSCPRSRCR